MSSRVLAVDLQNIARRFARRWVLRGASLQVQPGEIVAMLGKNGSGKTTLLRVIATSLRPTRGTGFVYGNQLVKEADEVRECVGVLGHYAGLYDDLTAGENLRFATRMSGMKVSREVIHEALERVSLGDEINERVRGFSAGMRRRLALARLILRPPQLMLLDEPYAAFDQHGIDFVNEFVRDTATRGGAAIIVTHDPARVAEVSTRMVRIVDGRIEAA
ncbi:MAG TPA: heme ABC exporter ATP-binding protein CcmA [Longimicrobiales bacterium]|nr:heme ABC exporter ATP-binding protein CcmA [Longimicrobiales bacterium]